MDFLGLAGKTLLVFGVANRKSVAYHVGQVLQETGAKVVYVVRSAERRESVAKLLGDNEIYVCDVEHEDQIARLRDELSGRHAAFDGLLHAIAFADYDESPRPFHETSKKSFLR